jgi:hypothetical protein
MKTIWLLVISCLLAIRTEAQFQVGYKFGYWNPSEINRVIYLYNEVNDNGVYHLEKRMPQVHWFQGISVGFGFTEDNFFSELRWTNRHSVVSSKFKDKDGIIQERSLKLRSNFLDLGFGFATENFKIGLSMGIGNFKGWGKPFPNQPADEYTKLFQIDNNLLIRTQAGFTPFMQFNFAKVVGFRIFYQIAAMQMNLDYIDSWLVGKQVISLGELEGKGSNFGVELSINLGNKD